MEVQPSENDIPHTVLAASEPEKHLKTESCLEKNKQHAKGAKGIDL